MPLDDVITSPTVEILANKFNSVDQATQFNLLMGTSNCKIFKVGFVCEIQVIASLKVYTDIKKSYNKNVKNTQLGKALRETS